MTLKVRLKIIHHRSVESTQKIARELADAGADDFTVVVAEEQTGGLGRRGRPWFSPSGGLWLTIILRDRHLPNAALLGLTAASAMVDTLESQLHIVSMIKWPNDVYIGARKVGGILVDTVYDGSMLRYALVGVGLNVNFRVDKLPSEMSGKASTIMEQIGRPVDLPSLMYEYLERVEALLKLPEDQILRRVNAQLWKMDATLIRPGERVTGRILSVNGSGRPVLDIRGGPVRTLDLDFEAE